MKDSKQIRKVLYVSKSNVALVVMNDVDNNNNILFAHQVNVNPDNLQVKISELLTNAANFLGFNIKSVEMVFDDNQISRYALTEVEFADCTCEEDISKEIFKKAKIDNCFVTEINYLGIIYNEIERSAKVNCQICQSDYVTYKTFVNAIKACSVQITKSTNLYKLLKTNKDDIELTIKIFGNVIIACEYYGKKLNNVISINLNLDEIKNHISNRFNINVAKVDDMLNIANQLLATEDLDVTVANNYDMKTKSFNNVKVCDVISLYKDEVKTIIQNYVDCRNFHNVMVISDQAINHLDDFEFASTNEISFDNLSLDKIISLSNLDKNNEIDQYAYENKIKPINMAA